MFVAKERVTSQSYYSNHPHVMVALLSKGQPKPISLPLGGTGVDDAFAATKSLGRCGFTSTFLTDRCCCCKPRRKAWDDVANNVSPELKRAIVSRREEKELPPWSSRCCGRPYIRNKKDDLLFFTDRQCFSLIMTQSIYLYTRQQNTQCAGPFPAASRTFVCFPALLTGAQRTPVDPTAPRVRILPDREERTTSFTISRARALAEIHGRC